jgi:hypothetical protein
MNFRPRSLAAQICTLLKLLHHACSSCLRGLNCHLLQQRHTLLDDAQSRPDSFVHRVFLFFG